MDIKYTDKEERSVRKIILTIMLLTATLSLCSCAKSTNKIYNENKETYELSNGKTPTEVKGIIEDFVLNIYMPSKQDDIEQGVNLLVPIATEREINELKSTVGKFDESNRAMVRNLSVSICMPENSTDRKTKYLATFEISTEQQLADMLIEFGCNSNDEIETHSIWVDNK